MENRRRGGAAARSTLNSWLLNTGAVLGSLCLVLTALSLIFGLKPLIFSSGSMGPAIPTGSLALAVPVAAAEVSPGEVVSVVASDGTRITHRVVSADPSAGLVIKGDANAIADFLPYTGASVDRVLFSVPGLGFVVSWLASPWIFLLGGLLCAYPIYVAFFSAGPRHSQSRGDSGRNAVTDPGLGEPGTRRRTWLGIGAIATVLALVAGLGLNNQVGATQAAFTGKATTGSAVTALVGNRPNDLRCNTPTTGLGRDKKVVLSWNEPAAGPLQLTGYAVRAYVQQPDGSPPKAEDISVEVLPASARTLTLDQIADKGLLGNLLGGLLGGLLGANYNLKITFEVSAMYVSAEQDKAWLSEPLARNTINATSKGILGPVLPTRKLTCDLQ